VDVFTSESNWSEANTTTILTGMQKKQCSQWLWLKATMAQKKVLKVALG